MIGAVPPEPPPLANYTVSGSVRYYNHLTYSMDPLEGILVKLYNIIGQEVAATRTNSSGYYSMTISQGQYTLIIFAQNYAGEVHDCWRADVDVYPIPWPPWVTYDIDLDCSPPTYRFKTQQINLYSNLTVNYDADGTNSNRARILWRIQREKNWMYSHTSPNRTLDYIEVSYPAIIYIDMPLWYNDRTFVLERTPFYVYFGKLEAVKVKLPPGIPHGGDWWGVGVSYRNPHQIVINDSIDIWHPTYSVGALSHEWAHGLMVSTLGGKVPYDWGHAIHWYNSVHNTGHAFSEGFAEFCAPAMWVTEMGQNVEPATDQLEYFYANRRPINIPPYYKDFPYYRGRDTLNTNGSFVEGSVFQFLWDLFDDRNTNDHEQDFDDDGVYGGMAKIMNTLASLGSIMTAETLNWDTLGSEEGDSLAFKSRKAHFPGPDYDFVDKYKDRWHALNYGNISELFNVDIHPFDYLQPYPVPAPTNFVKVINHVLKKVTLYWHNNALNQGAFFVARNLNNTGYVSVYAIANNPASISFSESIQEGNSYRYKVRAFACDTSGYSNEVTIPFYIAAPTGLIVASQPNLTSVKLQWTDNSLIEAGFQIARRVD
ncbi:carboxypeptidase regulatory-like domain-containing protein, partial [candidate division WOR-3 bacterium]|nr:carboxypeptidase regulatory-like domain-containing protein [candidate division WOR-3 bacterium]